MCWGFIWKFKYIENIDDQLSVVRNHLDKPWFLVFVFLIHVKLDQIHIKIQSFDTHQHSSTVGRPCNTLSTLNQFNHQNRTWTNILLMKRIVSTYLGCSTTLCLTSPYWLLIFIKFYRNIMSFISFTTLLFSRVFIRTCWQVEDRDGTEVDLPVTDELTERRLCSVVSQPVSVIRPLQAPTTEHVLESSLLISSHRERRGDKRHSAGVSRQASLSNWCTFNHSDQLRELMEKIMGILTMMMKCLPVPWDWNLSVLVNVRIRRVM